VRLSRTSTQPISYGMYIHLCKSAPAMAVHPDTRCSRLGTASPGAGPSRGNGLALADVR
jgi:hypothetical protein